MSPSDSPLAKLQGFLTGKGDTADPTGMTTDKFRQTMERTLSESATGNALLRYAAQQRIAVHIIQGKNMAGYIPENRAVYIAAAPILSTVPPEAVLALGAYLRQAQLQILGFKNPDESMTSLEKAVAFDSKMLDNITIMCKIASALYEKGQPDFVDALARMGHGDMYSVFVEHGPGQHMTDVFYKTYIQTTDV